MAIDICTRCLSHPSQKYLKDFVSREGGMGTCELCGMTSSGVSFEKFVNYVKDCLSLKYVPTDSQELEGRFEEVETSDALRSIEELIEENEALRILDQSVITRLLGTLTEFEQVVEKSFFRSCRNVWDDFSNAVKHESRFFFFTGNSDGDARKNMLDNLFQMIFEKGLTVPLKKNSSIYRARPVSNIPFAAPKDLGPPPARFVTQQNRMSPAGIAMFYAAQDCLTAVRETCRNEGVELFSVATFHVNEDMRLLDLTTSLETPDLFDYDEYVHNDNILLYNTLREEFSKPIVKNGQQNIDYVPTQVFAEYARCGKGSGDFCFQVDGIVYQSSITGEKAYVLFKTCDDVYEDADIPKGTVSNYGSVAQSFILTGVFLYTHTENECLQKGIIKKYAEFDVSSNPASQSWILR